MSRSAIRCMMAAVLVTIALPAWAENGDGSTQTEMAAQIRPTLPPWADARPSTSPTLKALYASYGALQGLDIYSTAQAKRNGSREMNPLMDGGSAQMLGMKAASTAATYYFVQRMAKKNRKAAIITMAVLNGVTAAVVAHNMRNAQR